MMANNNSTGLTVERGHLGLWDTYSGTAEDLIAAGVVRLDQVPGQPGRPKTAATYYAGEPIAKRGAPCDEQYLHIYRRSARRFDVIVGLSENEKQRRRESKARAEELRRSREVQARAEFELFCMPHTHEDYRSQAIKELRNAIKLFCTQQMGPREWNGFRYDEDAIGDFNVAAEDLVEILEQGTTLFCKERHAARIAAIKGKTARADAPLQRFLATAQAADQMLAMSAEGGD